MGCEVVVVPDNSVADRDFEHLRVKGEFLDVDVVLMGFVLCPATACSGQTQESGTHQGTAFSARHHGSGAAVQVGNHHFGMAFMDLERH